MGNGGHSRSLCWITGLCIVGLFFLSSCAASGQKGEDPALGLSRISLPPPVQEGGKPILEAMRDRKSGRAYRPDPLPPQVLSNLLWAAYGINRPASGKRTAPSAMNWQEMDVYMTTAEGTYLYDPKAHALEPIRAGDARGKTGRFQGFVKEAPINLVFVADYGRMGWYASEKDKIRFSAASTGAIAQNVYLFCASEGLSTVVRGLIDRKDLARVLRLAPDQKIVLAQSVGYPAE